MMDFGTEVLANSETLMRQAPMTIELYLDEAIRVINASFGDETYADRHPELVAAFITACTTDFQTAMMKAGVQEIRDALLDVASAMREREW